MMALLGTLMRRQYRRAAHACTEDDKKPAEGTQPPTARDTLPKFSASSEAHCLVNKEDVTHAQESSSP